MSEEGYRVNSPETKRLFNFLVCRERRTKTILHTLQMLSTDKFFDIENRSPADFQNGSYTWKLRIWFRIAGAATVVRALAVSDDVTCPSIDNDAAVIRGTASRRSCGES